MTREASLRSVAGRSRIITPPPPPPSASGLRYWVVIGLTGLLIVAFVVIPWSMLRQPGEAIWRWVEERWAEENLPTVEEGIEVLSQVLPALHSVQYSISPTRYIDRDRLKAQIDVFLASEEAAMQPRTVPEVLLGLVQENPWVVDVRVIRILAGEILIEVVEQRPVALYVDRSERHWLLNAEGQAFVEIAKDRRNVFGSLLQVTGSRAPEYLEDLLVARHTYPELFFRVRRIDWLNFSDWRLWLSRGEGVPLLAVVVRGHDRDYLVTGEDMEAGSRADRRQKAFLTQLGLWQKLERRHGLSRRAVAGYDLRSYPKVLVEWPPGSAQPGAGS